MSDQAGTLRIRIQRKTGDTWPVVVNWHPSGVFLPVRSEDTFHLSQEQRLNLTALALDPLAYGRILGEALFSDQVQRAFDRAQAASEGRLRVLLHVEDPELKSLHWERLCGRLDDDAWDFLALDQRVPFSLYLPSITDRRFSAIGQRDLRVLLLVANPEGLNEYRLDDFDAATTIASVKRALGEIPCNVLATVEDKDVVGPPTLAELCDRITAEHYALLHIVAHGQVRKGETVVYLADEKNQVAPVTGETLIRRLSRVEGARGLPHFAFLATCESAKPEAGLGGLAQRLVEKLGMPAVLAMTEKVTIVTAEALAERFYRRLRAHGEPDRAMVEASAGLAERHDVTVPALYSRLGGRPLFSDSEDRELTGAEIEFGLIELERFLPERAPVLEEEFTTQANRLRGTLEADRASLSQAARQERDQAMTEVNTLCEEVLDLNFRALALGQKPPAYNGRCPFPGLLAFGARYLASGEEDDREFFFGREKLVTQLEEKLGEHNFLSVLGPSGSGKSSLVLAGLVPALQDREPGLQMAYTTPGSDPLAQLEASLSSHTDEPIILIVDQFEELFTHCTIEDRRRAFLDRLLSLSEKLRVVITMRADFWGDCAPYRDLAEMMQAHQALIAPMISAELRGAMEQQAGVVGLRFEADLSNSILDAVKDEPGAMPLLQHLLRQLWEHRHGPWLRATEYRAIGGVQQAIAHTAEKVYQGLAPEEQGRLQDIFVRLTRLDEDVARSEDWRDTRRRVGMEEVVPAGNDPAPTKALVTCLADARLVVTSLNEATGREEVEMAHEALIGHWPRLRAWLDRHREVLRLREGIRRAALEWQLHQGEDVYLVHREERLKRTGVLTTHPRFRLNELEQAYLDACLALQLEEVLLQVRSALARHEPAEPGRAWLQGEEGRALIRQLEVPDATDFIRRPSHLTLDRVASLLGLHDVKLPDRSGDGKEPFGQVAWSAVSHPQSVTRQTAALALTALEPYPQAALDRLRRALMASTEGWRHWLRKGELHATLADADPDNEQLSSDLSSMDRSGMWLWRVRRRLIRDRHRIVGLTVRGVTIRGALGAGLALALLRAIVGIPTSTPVGILIGISFFYAGILGAALALGMALAEPLLLSRSETFDERPTGWRASAVLAAALGVLFFGIAHFLVALLNGLRLTMHPLVVLMGFVAGLGLSMALYDQPRAGWHLGILSWLLRLGAAALVFVLTHWVFMPNVLAIGWSGSFYKSQFSDFVTTRWPQLVECCPRWYDYLALVDAALVGIVLTLGITAGLVLSEDWLKRRRAWGNQSGD